MARSSRPAKTKTFTVTLSHPMRMIEGRPAEYRAVLIAEALSAAQIAAALVGGGALCLCEVCGEQWHRCPQLAAAVQAELPATRAEFVAINARHGVTVTPLA